MRSCSLAWRSAAEEVSFCLLSKLSSLMMAAIKSSSVGLTFPLASSNALVFSAVAFALAAKAILRLLSSRVSFGGGGGGACCAWYSA